MAKDGKHKGRQRWRCTNPECPVKTRLEGVVAKTPKSSTDRWREWRDRTPPDQRPKRKATKSKDEGHCVKSYRFTEELAQAISDRAQADGVSNNRVVVEALTQYLKKKRK